jgi:multiple sugar transport system substrate-binding protein
MKRLSVIGLSVAMISSLALSACGKTETNNGGTSTTTAPTTAAAATTTPAAPAKTVNLKFWGGVPEESGPKAVVDKWNASHKDIQVEYVRFVNDDPGNTKLDTALLSTNDAPDIFVSYGDVYLDRRVKSGMAEPMDDLIKKVNFDVDGVIGSANIVKKDNKIYYLPGAKGLQVMFFNKAMLDAVGEKVPTDWTWDEYVALGKKLTKSGQVGAYLNPTWEPIAYDVLMSSQPINAYFAPDGSSNLNSPALKKGLEVQKQLLDAKAMVPYAEGIANKLQPQDELLKGRTAMVYSGTYLFRYIKDDKAYPDRKFSVAFAPVPQMEKGKNVNGGGLGDYLSINAKSANKEASMKFLDWYLKEGNLEMVAGGRIPSNLKSDINKVADIIIADKSQYFDKESFMNVLKANYTYKLTTNTTAISEQRKALMEEAEKYFMNVQSIDKTIETIKKKADDAIKAATK